MTADWSADLKRWRQRADAGDDALVVEEVGRALASSSGTMNGRFSAAVLLIDALGRAGRDDEALARVSDLEASFSAAGAPSSILSRLRAHRVSVLLRLGRTEEALALHQQLRVSASDDLELQRHLLTEVALRMESDQLDVAISLNRQCLDLGVHTGTHQATDLQLRGRLLRRVGAPDAEVEAWLLSAIVASPPALRFIAGDLTSAPSVEAPVAASILEAQGVRLLSSLEGAKRFDDARGRLRGMFELAALPIQTGESDFARLRRNRGAYIDKTAFISSIVATGATAVLVTAPRRFGKSLNLSTLRYFLDVNAPERLFDGLAVSGDDKAMALHRSCSVLYLSLRNVRAETSQALREELAEPLRVLTEDLYEQLVPNLAGRPFELALLDQYRSRTASWGDVSRGLLNLSTWLGRSGRPLWILIDEYDAPLSAMSSASEQAAGLQDLRRFIGSALKDNPSLTKGVLTGVLRVTLESLFSDFNNHNVYPLHQGHLGPSLGFEDFEVRVLCAAHGVGNDDHGNLRRWYDGYRTGGASVFNPWSVLNYLQQASGPTRDRTFQPFWARSGDPKLLRETLSRHADELKAGLVELLAERSIERAVDEGVGLSDLVESADGFWTLLLYTGYLTGHESSSAMTRLSIPNEEVRRALLGVVRPWLERQWGGAHRIELLFKALLRGDSAAVEDILNDVLVRHVSSWDVAKNYENPYHMLFLGLLVSLSSEDFRVRSNREAGHGRYDIAVEASRRTDASVVIEVKAASDVTALDDEANRALEQISGRSYVREFQSHVVYCYGIAATGKHVRVLARAAPPAPA